MKISHLKLLLESISQFYLSSSNSGVKSDLVQKYCHEVDEILKLLEPVVDEIIADEIALDEQQNRLLEELGALINEAREHINNWHQMTSKVYFVLKIEPLIGKIQTSTLGICRSLSSLFLSLEVQSGSELVELCIQKIQPRHYEETSSVINEVLSKVIVGQLTNNVPSPEHLLKIAHSLSLSTNQELLMETVSLENMKTKINHGENHGDMEYIEYMIELLSLMQSYYIKENQVKSINNVLIPADFCCPLSLEIMSDPVIVASGQTYERTFIKKWLDQGFNFCPKTRQAVGHTNLIPNYIVNQLIANWCEMNNIKLPDPATSVNSDKPSILAHADSGGDDCNIPCANHLTGVLNSRSSDSSRSDMNTSKDVIASNGSYQENHLNGKSTSSYHLSSQLIDGLAPNAGDLSLDGSNGKKEFLLKQHADTIGETSSQSKKCYSHVGDENHHFNNKITTSSSSGFDYLLREREGNSTASQVPVDLSDTSSEMIQEAPAPPSPRKETESSSRTGESLSRSHTIWRRPSQRFSPIISLPTLENRPDLSGLELDICKLIEEMQSESVDVQRTATSELLDLTRHHNMENRIVIANCGAITPLVNLLLSPDLKTQENAVTSLLNLSLSDNNKSAIGNADSIGPLIHVLKMGNSEAQENAAAILYSLSVVEENKVKIGRSGAIGPLVELLGNGSALGKKDASVALYNLSLYPENKARIVQAGAVRYLVELLDPAAGMVDRAVAILSNLATIPEGRKEIGHNGGIVALVEIIELGSLKGKEHAAAALLQLCSNSSKFCSMALHEGAVPPLVALSLSGTARAREKAQALLGVFRSLRHGKSGRP